VEIWSLPRGNIGYYHNIIFVDKDGNMRILIVDDSSFAQHFTRKMLEVAFPSAQLLFASDGAEGYKMFLEHNPDYIISDLLMPNMDGKEMIKLIREKDENSKIIVLSSDIQRLVKEEISDLGVLHFINKPLTEENGKFLIAILGGK
jgi:two-component system chemotaxis response regulator CheY